MEKPPLHLGVLSFEIFIPASESLKAKRHIIKSLKDRVRHRFNVSIAEIADHDKWQRSGFGVSMINNDKNLIQSVFQEILNLVNQQDEVQLISQAIEFV